MKKKKLLVTASTFPRWEGDTEPRFVLDLCKHMVDTFDVTVLVPATPGAKDREVLEGVEVIRYHYFPIHKWETLCYPGAIVPRIKEKKIRAILVPFLFVALFFKLLIILPKYDIVHAHWLIPQGIVQSFFKKPYIVTGHGGDVTSLNKGIVKKLKERCLKEATDVTTVSQYLSEYMRELETSCKPHIISMGVDLKMFGSKYRMDDFFGQKEKKVILFVGRLAEKKGVTYLIDAMKKIENAILVIVGEGPLNNQLKKQALYKGDQIRFLGAKSHEELKTLLASADIFVAPSITANNGDSEGLGLVLLEAMASGLPVVATRTGGIVQIIEDGINGFLVEEKNSMQLAEAISQILSDDKIIERFKEKGFETIKKYDYREISKQYKNLYERALFKK